MTNPTEWSPTDATRLWERVRRLTAAVLRGRASEAEKDDVGVVVALQLLARPPAELASRYIANLIQWRFVDLCRERDPEGARRTRSPDGPFWDLGGNRPVVNEDGEELVAGTPDHLLRVEEHELGRIAAVEIDALKAAALARCRGEDSRATLQRNLEELERLVRGEVTIEELVAAGPDPQGSAATTLYKRHERARLALLGALSDVPDRTLSAFLGITTHDLLLAYIESLRRQRRRRAPFGSSDG